MFTSISCLQHREVRRRWQRVNAQLTRSFLIPHAGILLHAQFRAVSRSFAQNTQQYSISRSFSRFRARCITSWSRAVLRSYAQNVEADQRRTEAVCPHPAHRSSCAILRSYTQSLRGYARIEHVHCPTLNVARRSRRVSGPAARQHLPLRES